MAIWNVPLNGGKPWRTTLRAEWLERSAPVDVARYTVDAKTEAGAIAGARAWAAAGQRFKSRSGVPVHTVGKD